MKRAWYFFEVVAGLVFLGALALGVVTAFQALSRSGAGGAPAETPQAILLATQTPQGYPPPPTPAATPLPEGYPLPTPVPTWSEAESTAYVATRSAQGTVIAATTIVQMTASAQAAGPLIGPQTIHDPSGQFTLTLQSGWRAYFGGTTYIINYDDENLGSEGDFPPGGLKIQIGVGELAPGQSFEQWLSDWIAISTASPPDSGLPSLTATEPRPHTLGRYEGVTYFINDRQRIMEIVLTLGNGRVMIIGLTPADSPALSEALSMLSTIEIASESIP